jgi:hypothetical protein
MRLSHHSSLSMIAAVPVLLAACNGDPAATMAPTTPNFSQTSVIFPFHGYLFSLSCSHGAPNSNAQVLLNTGGIVILFCGSAQSTVGITSFDYSIGLLDQSGTLITGCVASDNTFTGDYRCKSKKWSATLTVTDLTPALAAAPAVQHRQEGL